MARDGAAVFVKTRRLVKNTGAVPWSARDAPVRSFLEGLQAGNLYIADYWNYRIRRVDAQTGIITTVAGNGQASGKEYDGTIGMATQISIGVPTSIAVSPAGEPYWTTPGSVLKIDSQGMLSIVAGNGGCLYTGDGGPPQLASLCQPYGLAFDSAGDLFVGEGLCGCVRRIEAATGLIQTVAGTGTPGTSTDGGPATQAQLSPNLIAVAGSNLYIIDHPSLGADARIRLVTPDTPPPMPQPPAITAITNAIDYTSRFSPGALVSVMGNYLSSPSVSTAQIGADGRVTSMLAGDTVTFNGTAGPLLYVSPAQINAAVPYSAPLQSIPVEVNTAAGTASTNITVAATSVAVLSGVVFNPDGQLNSQTTPAPKGATLVLYGTGMGQTNPAGVDGAIIQGPPYPTPLANFTATLSGTPQPIAATITYLGPLPGAIAGAMQVNVQMPDSAPPGLSTLAIGSGFGSSTQPQNVYLLSDPPAITSITPASPMPQMLGTGVVLTLNGTNLNKITGVTFYQNGQPLSSQQLSAMFNGCTATACSVFVSFAGLSGSFGVAVVNAANQASNLFVFTVAPPNPPAVTSVEQPNGTSPLVATKGTQTVRVDGSDFQTPLTLNLFYNGSQIATLSSANLTQIWSSLNYLLEFNFDFQGNAGQYGVQVVNALGSSPVFTFTVNTP